MVTKVTMDYAYLHIKYAKESVTGRGRPFHMLNGWSIEFNQEIRRKYLSKMKTNIILIIVMQ